MLKLVRGKETFVFIGNEAYYGKLETPPRARGGFEIFYTCEGIENP